MKPNQEHAEIDQLYENTAHELRRLLVHKLGNRHDAEEIAQDAYLKLCRIRDRSRIRDLRKFLFTMSVRMALNALRKRRNENRRLLATAKATSLQKPTGSENSVYEHLVLEQKLDLVREALIRLPEKTRYIFLLHRFEGLSYAEIAGKVGLSVKAIEYHMGRALEKVVAAE